LSRIGEWKAGDEDGDGDASLASCEKVDDVRDDWVEARRPVCRMSYRFSNLQQ
jgi:hypothetical protein